MKKASLLGFVLAAVLVITAIPVQAWVISPNPAGEDNKFELYGPHVKGINIIVYSNTTAEWTAMAAGQLDLEDWALDAPHVTLWSNNTNGMVEANYGGEGDYYLLDINNNATYAASDSGPFVHNPTSELPLRQALAYAANRSDIVQFTGGLALPMYTPVPNYMAGYVNHDVYPTGSRAALTYGGYTGDLDAANALLNASGYTIDGSGWRIDPVSQGGNGQELNLIFYSRQGDRGTFGDHYNTILNNILHINTTYYGSVPRSTVTGPVFSQEYFNLYTGGWALIGSDPDYLCDLYNGSNYYHPGTPNNYDGINYADLNGNLTTIKLSENTTIGTQATLDAQIYFAQHAAAIPLWSYTGIKCYKNNAVANGGQWKDLVNQKDASYAGVNGWWSTLDMEQEGNLYPDSHAYYGFSNTISLQNIVYTDWYWDLEVLDRIYDCGARRDPITLASWVPQLYKSWTVGNWSDPSAGGAAKTAVTITLRPDVYWSDGQPFTAADVYYTLVEISNDLLAKGFSPPWWYPTIQYIRSVRIIDDYNIQILMGVNSAWAVGWVIGNVVIPMHTWKPIVDASTVGSSNPRNVDATTPDPYIIGTGPYRWYSGVGGSTGQTIVLVSNSPGSSAPDPATGLTPLISPGYYFYNPVYVDVNPPGGASNINISPTAPNVTVPITISLRNMDTHDNLTVNKYVYVNGLLQPGFPHDVTLQPMAVWNVTNPYPSDPLGHAGVETLTLTLNKNTLTYVTVAVHVKGPSTLADGEANPWISTWTNVTLRLYVTIKPAMSVSPSIVSPTDDQTIGTRFNVTLSLDMAENVSAYQVAMHYDRTELMCVDASVTGYTTSRFMAGHVTNSTVSIDGPVYGNGSVLVAETCHANDSIQGPHSGTLFWIEFQMLQTPGVNQTLNSTFDISTEYTLDNTFVADPSGNHLAFAPYDGTYEFVGPTVMSTPAGTNVVVAPTQNVNITFANITTEGFTTLSSVQPATPQFVSVVCDQITTNASYIDNITLQFAYNPGLSLQDQQAAKIWVWNSSATCWVDITTGVNTTSHTVSGVSPHLSMFGVTCDLGITGDIDIQGTTTVSIPSAPPAPPHSLAALNYYQINTTKSLSAPISLSLAYNYGNVPPGEEIFTQMWMWNESSASWVDITTGVNTTSHMVYGSAPHLSMFGVTSLPRPPDGIAVASANCPKTVVCQGYSANINVTICNQGTAPQTDFNVTLFCNTTLLATFHIDQLNSLDQMILNFTWNTAGWAKGNYSVSTCSDSIGWIRVSMVGDLTGGTPNPWAFVPDGKVDGKDITIVALCYGSAPGCPAPYVWNANCDVNNDGKIDGKDIALVALHYGQAG